MKKILFHSLGNGNHCLDGFTSAYCAWKKFGEEDAVYIPVTYDNPPPEITDQDEVYILDFSYKREVFLNQILKLAKSVVVLDHHKTAEKELLGIEGTLFDMSRSGAQISWDYFFPDQLRPALIEYVADRDLWKKELPLTEEINLALNSFKQEFAVYDALANLTVEEFVSQLKVIGWQLLKQKNKKLNSLLTQVKFDSWVLYEIGIVELDQKDYLEFRSDLGNLICEKFPVNFAVIYCRDEDQYNYSLRSKGSFDVTPIAESFGGGGHRNAAGFSTTKFEF